MRKTLKECDLYEIDNKGNIYHKRLGNKLKANKSIHMGGKPYRTKVVVANNLLDNPNDYKHVINIDKNKDNNLVSNIKWSETTYGDVIFDKETDHKIRFKISVMVPRCHDKKSKDWIGYGSKGIYVHKEWRENTLEFVRWSKKNGYFDGAWLYRYDKSDGYTPDNCYWGAANEFGKLNCDMVDNIKQMDISHQKIADKYQITRERVRQLKTGGKLVRCNE